MIHINLTELWVTVPGFPDYQVSNHGRVSSQRRYASKLSASDVEAIRASAGGASSDVIARHYGVHEATIRRIWDGKTHGVKSKILKASVERVGYRMVTLYRGEGGATNASRFYVHDLVAAVFLGDKPSGLTVNHKDGDKTNNRPDNLEYLTQAGNVHHAIKTGLWDPFAASRLGIEAQRRIREQKMAA